MQHRLSMVVSGVLAIAVGALLIVLGSADDAAGRGAPAASRRRRRAASTSASSATGRSWRPSTSRSRRASPTPHVCRRAAAGRFRCWWTTSRQPAPFLDIRNQTNGSGEQGLLGLAFHPNYARRTSSSTPTTRTPAPATSSSPSSRRPTDRTPTKRARRQVIRIRHRFADNHNGGQLLFGPDGFLYMATGDGGDAGDPRENERRTSAACSASCCGSTRSNPPGARDYRSPKGNPFKGRRGRDAIFARGLRNPFRFTFDADTERIAIGDVGQYDFEEIDYEGPTGPAWRELRLGPLGGLPALHGFGQRCREDPEGQAPRQADPRLRPRPGLRRHRRSGGPRRQPHEPLRALPLRRLTVEGTLRSFIPALDGATDDKPLTTQFDEADVVHDQPVRRPRST